MLDCLTCPAAEELARYLLGHAPDERAGAIDRHLEECPRCLEALRVLRSDDSLAAALRDGRPDPVAVDTVVSGLIERLKDTAHGARVTDTTPAEPGPNGELSTSWRRPGRRANAAGSAHTSCAASSAPAAWASSSGARIPTWAGPWPSR